MIRMLANDIINDVSLIQTSHKLGIPNFHVRYGLQITPFINLEDAMKNFNSCQLHALNCKELID